MSAIQPDLFADDEIVCATCGEPSDEWAVEREGWQVCPPCHADWLAERRWQKVEPERVKEILAAGVELPPCKTCAGPLAMEGNRTPLLFVIAKTGEVVSGYCRACTEEWRAQQTAAAIRADILGRVGKGRSKGLLTQEMLKEGRRLADVRIAFEMLLEAGDLVQHKGIVRRPSRARLR